MNRNSEKRFKIAAVLQNEEMMKTQKNIQSQTKITNFKKLKQTFGSLKPTVCFSKLT